VRIGGHGAVYHFMIGMSRVARFAAASLMLTASATKASATDVQCIEASKYKYLYQLFDDDRRRFADYFGLDADVRALPDPEFCRAALLSGPTGESGKDEFGDLVRMIARNRGWLAAIYLSSPGGSGSPFEMAFLLRKMRIKTVFAVDSDRRLVYSPDFAPTPPALVVPPTSSAVCYLKDQIASRSRTINTISGIVRPNPFEPTYEVNTDRPGADIRSVDLPRADGRLCQQRCQNEPRCRAWTFNGPPRINRPVCWLKFDVPAARDSEEGTISGVVRPQPFKPTFEPGFDFRGNDYNRINLSIADPRLCQQQCQADGRCRAWAYNGPGVPVPLTGWERYRKTQAALSPINVRFAECASSCSFIHSGGVDRSGPVNVHRPSAAHELSDVEDRQAAGTRVRRFFEDIDAGEHLDQMRATTSASS